MAVFTDQCVEVLNKAENDELRDVDRRRTDGPRQRYSLGSCFPLPSVVTFWEIIYNQTTTKGLIVWLVAWHSGIERRSLTCELSLSCAPPAADG